MHQHTKRDTYSTPLTSGFFFCSLAEIPDLSSSVIHSSGIPYRDKEWETLFLSSHKTSQPNNIEPCAHPSHLAH